MKHLRSLVGICGEQATSLQSRELLLLICAPKIHSKSLPHGAWPGPPQISDKQPFRWDFVQSLHLECFSLCLCEFLYFYKPHLWHLIDACHFCFIYKEIFREFISTSFVGRTNISTNITETSTVTCFIYLFLKLNKNCLSSCFLGWPRVLYCLFGPFSPGVHARILGFDDKPPVNITFTGEKLKAFPLRLRFLYS